MIGFSILIGVRNIIYNSVTFLIHQTWKRSAKPVKYFPVNLEILRTAWDIAQAFGQRRPAEDTSVRTAAAVRRVLCTSEENETLICTAAKVEAIDSDKEAQCLLEDAIIYGRLLELISYPEEYRKLSPAFTRAFANILARGCSISLLVEPSHRHLYPKSGSLAKIGEFGTRTHPLQWNIENVHTALEHGEGPLDKSTSSVATLRLFFDLLHIVLADGSGDTEFGHWFSRVTGRFSPAEQCPVAMIRAVSAMMHLLRGDLLPLRLGEGSFFARRCLRIGAVKELIHGAIWKVPVEQRNQDVWVSLLELIDNALLPPSSALPKQQHFEMEKWTLDHTLNIACGVVNSEADCNAQPLRLVRLLRSLDNLDSLDVGNNSSESNGLDNRARTRNTCVRSLSQCLTRLSLAQQTFGSLGNEFLEHMFAHLRDFKINITRSRQLRLLDEALLSEWDACWVALPDPSTHQGDHLPESHKSAFQYYQKRYPQLRADYQDLRTTLIQRLRTNSNRTMPTTSSPVGGLSAQEPEQQFRATTYASTTSGLLLPTPSPGQEAYTEG
ncbi:hypothetical protein FRB90_005783 [Tulasnella sp. 427]|nr:hypothetical protein FRB90_005783 [Tulasnella sp. 427]